MPLPHHGSAGRLLLLSALLAVAASGAAHAAVVVEGVSPEAAEAGIAAGDVLVAWRPAGSAGAWQPLATWLAPWALDHLELPRHGRLEVELQRDGARRTVALPPRPLSLTARPAAPAPVLAAVTRTLAEGDFGASAVATLQALTVPLGADVVSWALTRLAETAAGRGKLDEAVAAYAAAATVTPAPLSAELHRRRGDLLRRLGRPDDAEAAYREALAVWQRHAPEGLGASILETSLGNLASSRHELATAQERHEAACAIRRRLAVGSWLEAGCLNNLGTLAGRRNDLATAEARFAAALDIYRRLGMTASEGRAALANLGVVARLRGDLPRAEGYLAEVVAIGEQRGDVQRLPGHRLNLANVVADRGDDERALALYDHVITHDLPRAPDDTTLAKAWLNSAKVHVRHGDSARATAALDKTQAVLGFERPDEPDAAAVVLLRAELALRRGDPKGAAALCAEGLAAEARLRPDSADEAQAASLCARVAAARGEAGRAEELFRRSLAALERQQLRVGGGERGLVAFRVKLQPLYRAYSAFLVEQGRAADAFAVYERSRAQALRALLAQRDLDLTARVPPELERRRAALGAEVEERYRQLARLAPGATEGAALRAAIEGLHARREQVAAQIAATSPAIAALEAPPALRIGEVAAGLPAGTVVFAYDVGDEESRLFVVTAAGLVGSHALAVGAAELASLVDGWLELVDRRRPSPALRAGAARLSTLLLAPAAAHLRGAERLVVIPDGPLHRLSLAALPPPAAMGEGRYLVELLPVVRDVSASVFVAAAAAAARPASGPVTVVGDPGPSGAAQARFRQALGSLPASRREAAAVGALFGDRARVFVGPAATEAAVRGALPDASIAHFACHAVVDEQLPLDSALVLAPGAGSEGLLQAWEIAEDVRLDGALVVLSACSTARGGARAGEGIVGLVRALQIAGARSVVASLWEVGDESTAELMARFYRHLGDGLTVDAALRRAQLDLLRGPLTIERDGRPVRFDASAPRHWAAFVLLGSPQ